MNNLCRAYSLVLILILATAFNSNTVRATEIYAFKNFELVLPFLWATDVLDQEEYADIISGKIEHPLTIGRAAFTFLYSGIEKKNKKYLKQGIEILNVLDNYPHTKKSENSILYAYPDNYGEFEGKNWWSGMANSAIAVSYLLAFEVYGEEVHKDKAVKAMNGVINPISENGCSLDLAENSSWYLEYADGERNDSNSYFVHNGFMYSLVAIKYFEKVLQSDFYSQAFERGLNALENQERDYFFNDLKWTYYMLNPKTIESLHYSIFELILLEALISEDDRAFLKTSLKIRRNIIKSEYNLYHDQSGELFFSLIAGPHYYWQDLYPTKIVVHLKNEKTRIYDFIPRDFSTPIHKRMYLDLSDKIDVLDSIEIFQVYNSRKYKLYNLMPKKTRSKLQGFVKSKTETGYQGTLVSEQEISITSGQDLNRAMVRFSFPFRPDLYSSNFFGWVLLSDVNILSIKIDLINGYDESCGRYYVPQPQDTLNLILLKGISFENYPFMTSKRIKEVQINYFYEPFEGEDKRIKFSKIFVSDNPTTLYNIMCKKYGDFNFEEKKSEGNIY